MKRLRKSMMVINALVIIVTGLFDMIGQSLATFLYSCEWGSGLSAEVFASYYLLFYIVPALNLLALATNKAKIVSHKIVTLPPKGGL